MKKISLFVIALSLLISVLSAAEKKAAEGTGSASEEKEETAAKTAKPMLIRHGFLYSAEISKVKPEFQLEVKGDQPLFENPVWAAVMLKLPRNRGVSRFDYELKTDSGSYPCLAVALGAEPYSQKRDRWTIEAKKEQEGKFVRMLFAFPAADLAEGVPLQALNLVFKTKDSICQPPPIMFRILPEDEPLNDDPQTLGENGNIGLSWLDMHPGATAASGEESKKKDEEKAEEKTAE